MQVDSSVKTPMSGPISDVEWVEEVVPVFGKINKIQKQDKEGQGSTTAFLFSVIFSGFIAGAFYRNKAEVNVKENKIEKETEKHKSETANLSEDYVNKRSNEKKKNTEVKQAIMSVNLEKELDDKEYVTEDGNVKPAMKRNEVIKEVKQVVVTATAVEVQEGVIEVKQEAINANKETAKDDLHERKSQTHEDATKQTPNKKRK